MKNRVILVVAALLVVSMATAQSHYYGLVGDTIRGRCPIYHYSWYPAVNSLGQVDSALYLRNSTGCVRHTCNGSLKVIGLASPIMLMNAIANTWVEGCDTSLAPYEHFVLYDATPGGPVELGRICWSADYNTHPKRYIEFPSTTSYNVMTNMPFCDSLNPHTLIVPIREYYFDTAYTVADSFYIMRKLYQRPMLDEKDIIRYSTYLGNYVHLYVGFERPNDGSASCELDIPEQTRIYTLASDTTTWMYEQFNEDYFLVFPIIEVDTVGLAYDTSLFTCPAPGAPQVLARSANMARLRWGGAGSDEWQLSLMAVGDSATERLTVLTDTVAYLYGLSPDTAYSARVRARCRNANYQGWSPWSPAATLPALAAIGAAGDSTVFSLAPNPATDRLDVALRQAAAEGSALEVADLAGRSLLWHPLAAGTREAALDLGGLPAGLYLLRLHTPSGTATRRFVVAAR